MLVDVVQVITVTTCRIDHYQTPNTVCISVFAKKADKERSQVSFEESQVFNSLNTSQTISYDLTLAQVHLDLHLPDSKRFQRSLNLYGPILPDESSFAILGTKVSDFTRLTLTVKINIAIQVELNLKKKDGKSWNLLETTDKDIGDFNLIFGVGGRTGTIGAREAVVDSTNRLNA